MSLRCLVPLALLAFGTLCPAADPLSLYNVTWNSPSADHHGSMPLGNGELAANVWITSNGVVHAYLSKTDAWDDNARLVKIGKIRVQLEPNPIAAGSPFSQELKLREGIVEIRSGSTSIRLWVDAHHPVLHIQAESSTPLKATAYVDLWRTNRQETHDLQISDVLTNKKGADGRQEPLVLEPDVLLSSLEGQVGWLHHNRKSVGHTVLAELQGLEGFPQPDPILQRTFGGILRAINGQRLDDRTIVSPSATSHVFSVYAHTQHPATPDSWLQAAQGLVRRIEQLPLADRSRAHQAWWTEFWDRSWIRAGTSRNIKPEAEPASPLPTNNHPLRVGFDQSGGTRFQGELGRLTLLSAALSDERIAALAKTGSHEPMHFSEAVLYSAVSNSVQIVLGSSALPLKTSFTIEGWIKPASTSPGRILDKITPGGSDGFLLDTHPGTSARFICGETTLESRDSLATDTWTHIAAVANPGESDYRLYVNGNRVQGNPQSGGSDDAAYVSQMYHLQRFITACAGRGHYPIKFNGSLFTVPPGPTENDPDFRRWGPGYWWQNTRLPYISLCTSGDFDLQQPLFQMYARDLLPLSLYRTRHYLGHGGAYYPECIMFWGAVFGETYGWTPFAQRADKLQESGWHKWEWVGGLELCWMMLDYYDHTRETAFLSDTVIPFTREILTFFNEHYPVDEHGKLVFHPSQALETWWHCTNSTPEVAGCIAVTDRLLELGGTTVSSELRAFLKSFRDRLPEVPLRQIDGEPALAPAAFYAQKSNIENAELYPVFPFRLYAFNRPNADFAVRALEHRWDRGNFGWRQDDVFMAYLGLTRDARQYLIGRARNHDPAERFPAFWGPNYDWTPDQDHGGILMKALQAMLLQTDGSRIFLLPAWPKSWNVEFKLHAPQRTVLEGTYRDGQLQELKVTPPSRRADVTVCP